MWKYSLQIVLVDREMSRFAFDSISQSRKFVLTWTRERLARRCIGQLLVFRRKLVFERVRAVRCPAGRCVCRHPREILRIRIWLINILRKFDAGTAL